MGPLTSETVLCRKTVVFTAGRFSSKILKELIFYLSCSQLRLWWDKQKMIFILSRLEWISCSSVAGLDVETHLADSFHWKDIFLSILKECIFLNWTNRNFKQKMHADKSPFLPSADFWRGFTLKSHWQKLLINLSRSDGLEVCSIFEEAWQKWRDVRQTAGDRRCV